MIPKRYRDDTYIETTHYREKANIINQLTRLSHVNELRLQHERLLAEAKMRRQSQIPQPTYTINLLIEQWIENITNRDGKDENINDYSRDDYP